MKKNSLNGQSNAVLATARAAMLGMAVGAAFCALLLIACAWAFLTMERVPQALAPQLILAVSALSAFLSGLIASKISRKRGLLCGTLAGALLFLLLLLAGLAVFHEQPSPATFSRMAVMLVAGAIGGFVAVSGKKKH